MNDNEAQSPQRCPTKLDAARLRAAALAVEGGCTVQDVPYETLAETLRREGHVIGR